MALLTAAHQHNSAAALQARSGEGGEGAAAPLAPLAAALGGRQLVLSAPCGAVDVSVSAA